MNATGNPSEWDDVVPGVSTLTNAELDEKLEDAVIQSQRSEKLVCCFLNEVRERGAFRDFGCSTIYDYAAQRFGFKERKTRYLLFLGRKVKELPQIREALKTGKLGWCKATRIASVATIHDETTWLDSALSLSVSELDRRIKDGTDRMASVLHFFVTDEVRVLWENGLETARRVAGVELSPSQAFEYMIAEFLATWGVEADAEAPPHKTTPESTASPEMAEVVNGEEVSSAAKSLPLFPFAEKIQIDAERDATGESFRRFILERDQWKCRYPGCNARKDLHVHHIVFRSQGGPNEAWNCVVLCHFHHTLLHAGQIGLKGRAPYELEWTPPKLMREVLERRRNRPSLWVGELEVREWPADPADKELVHT